MNIALTSLLVWLTAVELPAGTELQYAGTFSQSTKNGVTEVKAFSLQAVLVSAEDGSPHLAYSIDERGGGSWGWPERFGLIPLENLAVAKSGQMRLLYLHEGQQYPLSLRSPIFPFRDKLAPQASWTDGRFEYVVTRKRKIKDRECYQVEVSTNLGKLQTLVVEAASGILMSLEERVIIGRGDEFQLKMELQSQAQLSAADLAKHRQALDSLLALQSALNRTGDQKVVELTADQLKSLQSELPRIEKEADGTSWSKLVASVIRDLELQQKRLEGVAGLEKKTDRTSRSEVVAQAE